MVWESSRVGLRPALFALAGLALLVVTVASGAPTPPPGPGPIIVPDESDGALLQPPLLESHGGVLKADVTLMRAGPPGSNVPTLFGGLPLYSTPTLPPPSPSGGANPPKFPLDFAAGFQFTLPDGTAYPAQFPGPTLHLQPGDALDLTVHDRLPDAPGPTLPEGAVIANLHTHGLVVSPLDEGDNVYRTMLPDGTFHTRVVIPSTQQPGVDWYHTHRHGYVADQVYGGLAGMLQVGDPLDPWPQYKGKYAERIFGLTVGLIKTDPATDRVLTDPSPTDSEGNLAPYGTTWKKYVNGEYNPTLTIAPGETQIWTFADIGRNGNFNLGITDGNGDNPWQAMIFSYDGDTDNAFPRKTTLAPPVPFNYDGPTVLDPGARITMAVTAPQTPGTYYLIDNMHQRLQPMPQFWALATIHVEGDPATEPPPNLPPNGPVPDLYTATPDQHRTFDWSIITAADGTTAFPIDGYLFPDAPIVPIQVGQVEEWLLVNTSGVDHVFHIHQTDFAVIKVGANRIQTGPSTGPYRYTSLRDTVDIPPGSSVIVRFRVSPQLGKYVFHCHILPHEDGGMMLGVLAVPNEQQRRIALGSQPRQPAQMIIKDGTGKTLGALRRGRFTRGNATATGQLTPDDLTEDIVTAPTTPGAPPTITTYDGDSLNRMNSFKPFGNQHVGVSLAVGNIDDQGLGEIIAGRVGPGPSLVRVFRPDGTLVRELKGTLPGNLPNGVTVASSDFDGDNYDDVAVGAGSGHAPDVVGVSGFDLTNDSTQQLFSLTAAGGPTAGVNLAAGYYDPLTRPGLVANLITTPASGRVAGWAQVWVPYTPDHEHPGHSIGGPRQIASFRPLGRHTVRGLNLQVSRLGTQGLDALAAWIDPRKPVFVSIDDAGAISRIQTPVTAPIASSTAHRSSSVRRDGYRVSVDTGKQVAVHLSRGGSPVRGASATVTWTMLDMPMPQTTSALHETTPGVYAGAGPSYPMPGRWRLTIHATPKGKHSFTARIVSVLQPATG
jgi:suppressor of ftsI